MIDILLTIGGLTLLVVGGEIPVRGWVPLSQMMHIPLAVVGLTVVAFGTSSPELAVISTISECNPTQLPFAEAAGFTFASAGTVAFGLHS
jgi:Ca2+/Na+ antiporter